MMINYIIDLVRRKIALVSLILTIIYLYFTYTRFYSFIGQINLKSPYIKNSFTLVNPQGRDSIKYVALGDSLGAGVGSTDIRDTYVYLFATALAQKSVRVNVVNLSEPGATTAEVIKNQLPQVISQKPDVITLLIGVNDIHARETISQFSNNYNLILSQLKNNTSAKIILINIPYLGSSQLVLPPFNFILDFRTKEFNVIISTLSKQYQLKLIDLYGSSYKQFEQNPQLYSTDLFHPSNQGYKLWGQLINAD